VEQGQRKIRPQSERALERGNGVFQAAQLLQRRTAGIVQLGIVCAHAARGLVARQGAFRLVQLLMRESKTEHRLVG